MVTLGSGLGSVCKYSYNFVLTSRWQTELCMLQSYADQGHDLVGVLTHAYSSMEDYLQECLTLDADEKPTL